MAFYRKNIGGLHQMMRIVVGLAAAAAALIWLAAPISYLAAMMGVALVLSGLFGYCPTCAVTGMGRRSRFDMNTVPVHLFDAARLGDRVAIVKLLDIAQPDIRRYARSSCRTSADAEDAAQEALWLLSRRVGTIRSLAAFSGWLFTVVRRECMRLARTMRLQPPQSLAEIDLERSFGVRPHAELKLDIAAAIEALPPHYREVMLLRDLREMTIDELAESLGETRQSIKAKLHRARLLMREYLSR